MRVEGQSLGSQLSCMESMGETNDVLPYCTAICHKVLVMIYIYILYIYILSPIVYDRYILSYSICYIYIYKYSIFYHMVVHLLRMVAKSCTSWWFIPWFIGFQPSVWWRGISQPSTGCARNSQIEGQLLQVLVMVQPKKRVFTMRQTGFSWFTRLQPATDWQASADSCAEILQWLAGKPTSMEV